MKLTATIKDMTTYNDKTISTMYVCTWIALFDAINRQSALTIIYSTVGLTSR